MTSADGRSDAPQGKLPPQSWMSEPETTAVVRALSASGADVRFVGGCVRDALQRRPVKDIDIAVPLPPEQTTALLEAAGIRAVPTGIAHGTITAVIGERTFEITSLRVDVETDGRHARVAYTCDWMADAARRDFTFNALSCTPDGDVYDYFDGLADLGQGLVRFVGNAHQRIAEDVLRVLRFFRFYAHYGQPPADTYALDACRAWANKLPSLSGERVQAELLRTLAAPDPAPTLQMMRDARVLEPLLPEAGGVDRLRMLSWLDTRALRLPGIQPDPLRRLAALLATDAAGALAVATRLRLANVDRDRLVAIAAPETDFDPECGEQALRRLLHHQGVGAVRDRALLAWANELAVDARAGHGRNQRWTVALTAIEEWRPIQFPLHGRDVLALGIPAGPQVGSLLREVEAWWERDGMRADAEACRLYLRTLALSAPDRAP